MKVDIIEGNILDQKVEAIVNPWNRNIIPWRMLLLQGVSLAIKKRAGYQPFRELARKGILPLGSAVLTSAGKLDFKNIIHVAGINLCWISSQKSIRLSVNNAINLAKKNQITSIAFPLIGAGTGGKSRNLVLNWMQDELQKMSYEGDVIIVCFKR